VAEGDHFLTTVLKGSLQFVKGEQRDLRSCWQVMKFSDTRRRKKNWTSWGPVIARDSADASLDAVSADRRFATAYNSALQAAKMAIACAMRRICQHSTHNER